MQASFSRTLLEMCPPVEHQLCPVKKLEFRYTLDSQESQNELINGISIDIIYGLHDTSSQAVQMHIRTLKTQIEQF